MKSNTVNCSNVPKGIWLFNIDSHKILMVIAAHKKLGYFLKPFQVNIISWYHPSTALIKQVEWACVDLVTSPIDKYDLIEVTPINHRYINY